MFVLFCVYAFTLKQRYTRRYAEMNLREMNLARKLREKELEDSWSFNNSLDAEYSERWSTLPVGKNHTV